MAEREAQATAEFMELTNASAAQAKFFLESSDWNVQFAITTFFESCGGMDTGDEPEIVQEVPAPPRPPAQVKTEPEETKKPDKKKSSSTSSSSRIKTLSNLDNSDSSSEEEGQAFYAGGSEHSGQQILGPSKKKGDLVRDIFKSVREHGGEEVESREASSSKRSKAFGGTGYRLGQAPSESQVIPSTSNEDRSAPLHVTIKMWKAGFSVDDGPLKSYESHKEFLEAIKRGEVPQELVTQARGREVNVDLEDHHMEEFVEPKKKIQPFAGRGHVLGSPAPATVGVTQPMTEQDKEANEESAKSAVPVDSSQPTTTVQVRLMDGSRLLANLNHTHTVGDLRRFIALARPNLQSQTFYLRTTFPSAELTDDSKTLKEAGLLNAAVLLRLN